MTNEATAPKRSQVVARFGDRKGANLPSGNILRFVPNRPPHQARALDRAGVVMATAPDLEMNPIKVKTVSRRSATVKKVGSVRDGRKELFAKTPLPRSVSPPGIGLSITFF